MMKFYSKVLKISNINYCKKKQTGNLELVPQFDGIWGPDGGINIDSCGMTS